MFFQTFNVLACLALASARDTSKLMKTVPTISNSLVNLGKMEISMYFSGKHPGSESNFDYKSHVDYYPSPVPAIEETCPCTNFKQRGPSFLSDPTEIINKILKSNDLFKESSSSMCCESLEHLQENTAIFEFNPKNIPKLTATRSFSNLPTYSNFLQSAMPINMPNLLFNTGSVNKPKVIDFFMFPRKKDTASFDVTNSLKPKKGDSLLKPEVQVVGDKQFSFKPTSASVKKDLALMEKKNKQEVKEAPKEELQTDAPLVTNFNNRL